MAPRRADVLLAVAGAAVGAGGATAAGSGAAEAASGLLLGAALGGARVHPRATWAVSAALFVVLAAADTVPGGDPFAACVLLAGHAGCAGRWDGRWGGTGGMVALLLASAAWAALSYGALEAAPFFVVPAAWGGGRALREREQIAAKLAQRALELESERDAHAQLSVRYERARIASELHDIVAHAISVMVVQAGAGQRLVASDPGRTAETFEAIAGAARRAEHDLGRLVLLLGQQPPGGPAPDLAVVEELVARASDSGLNVVLRLEGDREWLASAADAAYHVVREGLTNVLRYASGATASVVLRGEPEVLFVTVDNVAARDDETLAGAGTGTGLTGLRERVSAVGGTLEAGPLPDGGWRLRASLPRGGAVRPV